MEVVGILLTFIIGCIMSIWGFSAIIVSSYLRGFKLDFEMFFISCITFTGMYFVHYIIFEKLTITIR